MTVAIGIGFTTRASEASLAAALRARLAEGPADLVATAADKASHPALVAAARALGLASVPVPDDAMQAMAPHLVTCSFRSVAARQIGSVAEAAALAAAGGGARLDGARVVSEDGLATTAIARRAP
jgi:cobalt-precorrin 5A hydrolase